MNPTNYPTNEPTVYPTAIPTFDPSYNPTLYPTPDPTPHEGGVGPDITETDIVQTEDESDRLSQKEGIEGNTSLIIVIVVMGISMVIVAACLVVFFKKRNKKQKVLMNSNVMIQHNTNTATQMTNYNGSNGNKNTLEDLDKEILDDVNHITKGGDIIVNSDEELMNGIDLETDFIIEGEDEVTAGNIINDESDSTTGETGDEEIIDDEFMIDVADITVQ
eukprot:267123_1